MLACLQPVWWDSPPLQNSSIGLFLFPTTFKTTYSLCSISWQEPLWAVWILTAPVAFTVSDFDPLFTTCLQLSMLISFNQNHNLCLILDECKIIIQSFIRLFREQQPESLARSSSECNILRRLHMVNYYIITVPTVTIVHSSDDNVSYISIKCCHHYHCPSVASFDGENKLVEWNGR